MVRVREKPRVKGWDVSLPSVIVRGKVREMMWVGLEDILVHIEKVLH